MFLFDWRAYAVNRPLSFRVVPRAWTVLKAYFKSNCVFTLFPAATSKALRSAMGSALCAEVSTGRSAASVILVDNITAQLAFHLLAQGCFCL